MLDDGDTRVLNQNDARPGDPDVLRALGPFDAQMRAVLGCDLVPDRVRLPAAEKQRLAREKRVNQMARARQYVEWVDAAHVFPCAGPPAFLDDDLFVYNDVDRDPANIFPDQTVFLETLARRRASTAADSSCPARSIELDGRRVHDHASRLGDADALRAVHRQARDTSASTKATGTPWLAAEQASWSHGDHEHDLVAELAAWFEPLLQRAPITSAGIAGNVVLDVGEPDDDVCIDFVESEVRRWDGASRTCTRLDVDRRLIEALLERHTEDWVNSLFLSCRFTAHRPTRELQRVRDDVLQGAVARAHRLRRAPLPRPSASGPTSSSSATAGASSGAARTARPTSPASARSTTACSRAACITGSSTSRPAAASRATTSASARAARAGPALMHGAMRTCQDRDRE